MELSQRRADQGNLRPMDQSVRIAIGRDVNASKNGSRQLKILLPQDLYAYYEHIDTEAAVKTHLNWFYGIFSSWPG